MTDFRPTFALLLVLLALVATLAVLSFSASAQNSTSNTTASPPSNTSNSTVSPPANTSNSTDPQPDPDPADPQPEPSPTPEPSSDFDSDPDPPDNPFDTTPDFVSDCLPVGSSTAAASVHVCGDRLEDGKVVFDVYSQERTTVYIAVADPTKTEGSVGTVEKTLSAGNSTVSVVSPSASGARWSLGNLEGFAFGTVGSDGRIGPAPTWFEFLSGFAGAVAGVLLNVIVAVVIVLYGRRDYIKQIW